jgi:hypothetical protein
MIIEPSTQSSAVKETVAEKTLDRLTPEEVEQRKYEIWSMERVVAFESAPSLPRLVGEGLDILDHLCDMGYAVAKIGKGGDSLENMVYGTDYNRNFSRRPNPLDHTIKLLQEGPRILLFSGGGNDIAGEELEAFINHKDMGIDALRSTYVDYIFGTVVKSTYTHLIRRVLDEAGSDVHIITHGYGWAIPDGRAVINLPWGWHFVGPWLRPALTKKNYIEATIRRELIRRLVDRFNQTLGELAMEFKDNFHYIDLRQIIADDWWVNELHLKNSRFGRVAAEFDKVIRMLS